MKKIVATIKPCKLDSVINSLHRVQDFPGGTISDVKGVGKGFQELNCSSSDPRTGYPIYKRLEICCSEQQALSIIALILERADTGNPDGGKISVISIDDAADISSKKQLRNGGI